MATQIEQPPLPIDRLPLAYLRCDADFCVLEWNAAAEGTFGYERKEALGRRATDLILTQPINEEVQDVIRRIRSGDMNANSVNENRTKNGRTIICAWFNTPLIDHRGRFAGVISLATTGLPVAPAPEVDVLSAREQEVFALLIQGYTNREIASLLHRSVKTVESHRARIAQKLGLKTRADFIRYAAKGPLPTSF